MAKALVTGGCGFIGSHVVDALMEAGHNVTVVDNRIPPHRPDVAYRNVDVMNFDALVQACAGMEHIFHLAAVANVNVAFQQPVYASALNIQGTTQVLEAARLQGARRVYLASTIWVYNGAAGNGAVEEGASFYPEAAAHIYTSSKLAAEMLCHNYSQLYQVPTTVFRYGVPYGPRMREELLIPAFLKRALNGQPLLVSGSGEQFRKFIYVSDLARLHVNAMDDRAAGETYAVEGLRKVTVLEVAEGIRNLLGDVKIEFLPSRPGDFSGREVVAEKAQQQLHWAPKIEFEQGLDATVKWFRDYWKI